MDARLLIRFIYMLVSVDFSSVGVFEQVCGSEVQCKLLLAQLSTPPCSHVIWHIVNREEWYCDLGFYLKNVMRGWNRPQALPHPKQNSLFQSSEMLILTDPQPGTQREWMAKATGARNEIPLCALTIVITVSFRPSGLISLERHSLCTVAFDWWYERITRTITVEKSGVKCFA